MKKFVGTVNGETFDNEKDFNEAASKAVTESNGTLSISSYITYVDDEDDEDDSKKEIEETPEEVVEDVIEVTEDDLNINSNPRVLLGGKLAYDVTTRLADKLRRASNKDEVKELIEKRLKDTESIIKKNSETEKELENEIDELQKKLYSCESDQKDVKARRRYYNTLLDILTDDDSNVYNASLGLYKNRNRKKNLFDYFYDLSFWDF